MIGAAQRSKAERTVLDDTCTVTRSAGGEWTPEAGLPSGVTTVYDGPCALTGVRDTRHSTDGGDERVRATHTLLVPVSAGPFAAGDEVAVASLDDTYWVVKPDERSHRVLQRVQVSSTRDAEGAPL